MKVTTFFMVILLLITATFSFADIDRQVLDEISAKKSVEEKSVKMFSCTEEYVKTPNLAEPQKETAVLSPKKEKDMK